MNNLESHYEVRSDSLSISLSQYLKKIPKSASIRKINLRFCIVTSTKDTHQIPKKPDICR